jgi:hypothetical protein
LTEYDRESRAAFSISDDFNVFRTDYDGAYLLPNPRPIPIKVAGTA